MADPEEPRDRSFPTPLHEIDFHLSLAISHLFVVTQTLAALLESDPNSHTFTDPESGLEMTAVFTPVDDPEEYN